MSTIINNGPLPFANCGGGFLPTADLGFGVITQETPVQHCKRRLAEAQQELAAKLLGIEALRQEVAQLERMVAAAEPALAPIVWPSVVTSTPMGDLTIEYCGECQRISTHGHFATCSRLAK
jgi:hypothetical protein